MAERGGSTTQLGLSLQNTVAAWYLAHLIHDRHQRVAKPVIRVRPEAPLSVDDVVVYFQSGVYYVQVKASLEKSGKVWEKMWYSFWDQLQGIDPTHDCLVLWSGCQTNLIHDLQSMTKIARNVLHQGPLRRQFEEFRSRLNKRQVSQLAAIKDAISTHHPTHINEQEIYELLRSTEVIFKGDVTDIEEHAVGSFLATLCRDHSTATDVFSKLRDLVALRSTTRTPIDYESLPLNLREKLSQWEHVDATSRANLVAKANECKELHNLVQELIVRLGLLQSRVVVLHSHTSHSTGTQLGSLLGLGRLRAILGFSSTLNMEDFQHLPNDWTSCKSRIQRLRKFAQEIRFIDEPFREVKGEVSGPEWMVKIARYEADLDATLSELMSTHNTLGKQNILGLRDLVNAFTEECFDYLYIADKRLRDIVGEIQIS